MLPCDGQAICGKGMLSDSSLERLLRFMAVMTMVMTVPQVIAVWTREGGGGASLVSWTAYLVSSMAWLVYGLRKRDRTIWMTCVGWIVLDLAIIAGIIARS